MEGRTNLSLGNRTMTLVRYSEILGPIVRSCASAVGCGFLLVHDNGLPHVARVCRRFLEHERIDTIDWPHCSSDLHPIIHFVSVPPPGYTHRSSVMPWSRTRKRSPRMPSVVSLGV